MSSTLTRLVTGAAAGLILIASASAASAEPGLAALSRVERGASDAEMPSTQYYRLGPSGTTTQWERAAARLRRLELHRATHQSCRLSGSSGTGQGVGIVRGVVVDGDGVPVADLRLRVVGRGKNVTLSTDTEGRYVLVTDVGRYAISLERDAEWPALVHLAAESLEVQVQSGDPSRIDFVLR